MVKILLAEDNKINQKVTSRMLINWGAEVAVVSNGLEAVEMVQEMEFDLVLMDIQMPVMDGLEATRLIRALDHPKFKKLSIIALSGAALPEIKEQLIAAGVSDYISKPFSPQDLYEKLEQYLSAAKPEIVGEN